MQIQACAETFAAEGPDASGQRAQANLFYVGGTLAATVSSGPFTTNWVAGASDSRSVTAKATDDEGNTRISAPAVVIISQALDRDSDVLLDFDEVFLGLDPTLVDTDGDGQPDLTDAFPFDPSRWSTPSPDAGDHTPPAIDLDEPEDAELLP